MSLDCYPLGKQRTIGLVEQPMAVDVAYDDDLFICTTNNCQSVAIYDLKSESGPLIKQFSIGRDIVLGQLIYCRTGDYIACVGHQDGLLSLYTIFGWRSTDAEPRIHQLDTINVELGDQLNKRDKLNSIDSCQRTGNLAACYGDSIQIFKYIGCEEMATNEVSSQSVDHQQEPGAGGNENDTDSLHSRTDTVKDIDQPVNLSGDIESLVLGPNFKHIISIKLTMWALKVCLVENYLSITAADHVQVLKLELLTLQIQSDGMDGEQLQVSQTNSSGQSKGASDPANFNGTPSDTTTSTSETTIATASCSMISDSNSTIATNLSSFNTTGELQLNNSDLSIITMGQQQQQMLDLDSELNGDSNQSNDDCITWNLNTKKLVKLPTLMHNTSTNLSSYHICHPLELLGPASESIACRVNATIYSQDFCQNQLEPVVMLCKQFDSDKDPVKSTHLQAIYLSSLEDQKRLSHCKSALATVACADSSSGTTNRHEADQTSLLAVGASRESHGQLLKSTHYELLASVSCFVATLTNCFVYSLHQKKVVRMHTITHPDLCLDLRPDLLNVHLLTPLGLQICSTGTCDSTFRYDWSSSSDLNLTFVACNHRSRVLTTDRFVILISIEPADGRPGPSGGQPHQCLVEFMEKPNLVELSRRIVHTVNHCTSVSIRSNLLSYLHASAQIALLGAQSETSRGQQRPTSSRCLDEAVGLLKTVAILLCKQLLQKKQTNVITNGRIDKAIKHLLDISFCDLAELMRRHLDAPNSRQPDYERQLGVGAESGSCEQKDPAARRTDCYGDKMCEDGGEEDKDEEDEDDEKPVDCDYELIRIYLKHSKYSQSLLDYLQANSSNESVFSKIISYMFEFNQRLLIKCAQRFALEVSAGRRSDQLAGLEQADKRYCATLLVDRLKQLAELDSTGINRATVLFTLAILYNALGDRRHCLGALGQIKPLNHLAITMCSNHELAQSIVGVVNQHYPDVFELFLSQLAKRHPEAARDLARAHRHAGTSASAHTPDGQLSQLGQQPANTGVAHHELDAADEDDEKGLFERKLKLVAEIPPLELADLLADDELAGEPEPHDDDGPALRAYLNTSINLLESQFILARLCDNSH